MATEDMTDMDQSVNAATTSSLNDQVQTDMDVPKRVGLIIFFMVFVVFGSWSVLAPIDSAAQASGTVTVESYSKTVQHLEGGIISEIHVRNGDLVNQGQALLELDDTQPLAQLEIANSQFAALKARESRLIAERDNQGLVTYTNDLNLDDSRVRDEIAAQNEIFDARKASLEGSIEVLQQRIEQLQSQIVGLEALRASKQQLATSYGEEVEDTLVLLEQGFSEKTRLRELERNLASFEGEAADLTANIASTGVQISETRLQILQEQREFQNSVVSELAEVQTNLNDVTERISALQDVVSRTTIRAPSAGIVNGMQFHTVGGVIAPGTKIVDIVPQGEDLIVEASISPIDIDSVALNQEATIRFSSFGRNSVPTIYGTVVNLSADALVDETNGNAFYIAQIEVTQEGMADLGDLALIPGMPAEVFITTGSRTFLRYLFKPLSNAIARSFNED